MKGMLAALSAAVLAAAAFGADKPLAWPQFRGPSGSGVADDQKPPLEIGPDKKAVRSLPVPDPGKRAAGCEVFVKDIPACDAAGCTAK